MSSTSASVGKRPSFFLEKTNLPSTEISNTPPLDLTSSIAAPGSFSSLSLARRARGS